MATLISTADGNLTGSTTFAAAEVGAGALQLARFSASTLGVATFTTPAFTVTSGKIIDAVLLFVKQAAAGSTGTLKVDLQKSGVSQASVTVNKIDLPDTTNAIAAPVLFKLTTTATGDGAATWTIVLTVTGTNSIIVNQASGVAFTYTRALRTTTTQAPAAADDLYIVGELTGAATHNSRLVTMDSTAATAYGNGALNSTSVAGGGIHVSNYGTLTYGTTASTAYILRVNGDLMVYQFGTLNIISPQTSTTQVLEFQPVSADGDFGLRCLDNSTVTITGQPRTAGKAIVKCKLTADVVGNSVISGALSATAGSIAVALDASGNSLLATGYTDNATSATHYVNFGSPSVTNVTQTATIWLARGSGTNNRYVRVMITTSVVTPVNGFYSDIDLQAGTAGTVTAIGNGTATSVSITPVGTGYLVRITGKVSSAAGSPSLVMYACAVAGTTTYTGNTTQCFIFDHASIITAASISDTTFNVDTDTGWLANDAVCVASTTRTAVECEIYPLTANATSTALTSALYPFGEVFSGTTYQTASTHSGTTPTQAEIGLLTRNVKIRSTSTTLMAYVYCTALATVTVSWAEFYYFGTNSANKRGIEIDGGAVTNPKSFTYCSLHDLDSNGLYCNTSSVQSLNLTFSNNVVWNNYANATITISGPITNTDWTFDSNLVMRTANIGMTLADLGGICTNNTMVGTVTFGFSLTESGPLTLGTFDSDTVHSGGNLGINLGSAGLIGTISNFTAWRNTLSGVSFAAICSDLVFTNLILFGNSSGPQGNFNISTGDTITIKGGLIAGDTLFPVQYGFNNSLNSMVQFNLSSVDMSGTSGIYAPHTIADFNTSNNYAHQQGNINNCKFGAPALLTSKSIWTKTSYLSFEKYNGTAGDHRTEMTYGQLRTDATVYHTLAPSMKMTPNTAGIKLESAPQAKGIQVAVNNGDTVTASVWVRKDATYTGAQPRLIVRANPAIGINADTVLATDTTTKSATGYAIWNPSDMGNATLSGNNLIATASVANAGGRALVGYSSGKYYFEYTFTHFTQGNTGAGLMQGSIAIPATVNTAGITGFGGNGGIYVNGTLQIGTSSLADGNIIGVAVDLTAQLIWYRLAPSGIWNGSGTANPATGVGGFSISVLGLPLFPSFHLPAVTGQIMTANFGASAFSGAVPSGFTSGWTLPVYPGTWVQLSSTTAAATDDGVMEFIVDCDGTLGFTNLDDWSFTTGGKTSTNDMGNWFNGLPASGTEGGGGGAYFSAGFV